MKTLFSKHKFLAISFFVIVLAVILLFIGDTRNQSYQRANLLVNGYQVHVLIAKTVKQINVGLAIKNNLRANEGMLFVLPKENTYRFWMKDMKFPLDIIWLDDNKVVRHIASDLPPCPKQGECPFYTPGQSYPYVLEVSPGFAKQHHIIVNQTKVYISEQSAQSRH